MDGSYISYLPHACGLYLYVPNTEQPWRQRYLPCSLAGVKVRASILDMVSRVTLSQTFTNENAQVAYEAVYRFPLYENSAVCGFEMEHSGRKIVGIVQGEKQAIQTYESAKAEGKTAALVLQKEPDIFQTKVGNVPPKTSITVTLTYITPLKQDTESNAVRFTLPTVIAPRYGDATNTGTSNIATSKTGFELIVDATMPSQIISVSSPSHPIAMTLSDATSASVTLSNLTPSLDKDVVILVSAKDIDEPRCVIETHPSTATKCAMFTLVPKFNLPRAPTEVIFIIDRSGSMHDKIDTLKRALHLFLKSLPAAPEIYFNICSFGSHFDYLFNDGRSKKYDAKSLETAERYIKTIGANYGGTEILQPLLDCMKKRRADCQTSIILLTDGEVCDTGSILNSVSQERAKNMTKPLRIFSLGIGRAVSHHLVEGLARAGGGYSQLVMEQERLDKKVVRMLSASLQVSLNDLHLDWPGKPSSNEMVYTLSRAEHDDDFEVVEKQPKVSTSFFDTAADDTEALQSNQPPPEAAKSKLVAPTIQQFPETIPPLYNLSRHVVYLLFPASRPTPRDITLKGTTPDGSVMSLNVPITEVAITDEKAPIIHTLAARTLLGELQEGRLTVQQTNPADDSFADAVTQEGVRIGVKWDLASKWTSFVAVDEAKPDARLAEDRPMSAGYEGLDRGKILECNLTHGKSRRRESAMGSLKRSSAGFGQASQICSFASAPQPQCQSSQTQYQSYSFGSSQSDSGTSTFGLSASGVSSFASDRSRSGLGGSGFGSTPFGSSASGSSTFTSFAGAL